MGLLSHLDHIPWVRILNRASQFWKGLHKAKPYYQRGM
jgi:hypothetical protein